MADAADYERAITALELGSTLTERQRELIQRIMHEAGPRGNRVRRALSKS